MHRSAFGVMSAVSARVLVADAGSAADVTSALSIGVVDSPDGPMIAIAIGTDDGRMNVALLDQAAYAAAALLMIEAGTASRDGNYAPMETQQ